MNGPRTWLRRRLLIEPPGFFLKQNLRKYLSLPGWSIGEFSYGSPKIVGANRASLRVGKYVSISPDVIIFLSGHNTRHISTFPFDNVFGGGATPLLDVHAYSRGNVTIGNDVWIGEGSYLLSGVTIGDGAIVGAGSVVREDVAPYSVVVGNPARHHRFRFSESVCQALLELEWWNFPHESVLNASELLRQPGEISLDDVQHLAKLLRMANS